MDAITLCYNGGSEMVIIQLEINENDSQQNRQLLYYLNDY